VQEIDRACALASASAPAPAPAPVHHPLPPRAPEPSAAGGVGAARQSTLDRFVDSFTKRRLEKERPAPAPAQAPPWGVGVDPGGGGGRVERPGVRAGEGSSRQAGEKAVEDRFVESFTRRQREKERAAAEVAPAPAPAGGRGRPAARAGKGCSGRGRGKRAGKGCSRRPNVEVDYGPCAIALDHEAVKTWIYPSEGV